MYEKVNPCHPDKLADRIAGALVDLAYCKEKDPKIAVEVLIGHGKCTIIAETNVEITEDEVRYTVKRITGEDLEIDFICPLQDEHLALNQAGGFRCGDNGIFMGVPVSDEEKKLAEIAKAIYAEYGCDGKYILDDVNHKLIICQSNANAADIRKKYVTAHVNPIGSWTGGINVDSGATNRKLGSDMGDSVTGGGLHGKDLSKADVSVNIYAFLKAQETGKVVKLCCAIGDTEIDGKPYSEIVEIARDYIHGIGGFERFAEWGLIR